jgi:hypothetical protein
MITRLFEWYIKLYDSNDVKVIIATIGISIALVTFLMNYVFKPLFKFFFKKYKVNKERQEKKQEIKRFSYSKVAEIIQTFDMNFDKFILAFGYLYFKPLKDFLKDSDVQFDELNINSTENYELKIHLVKELVQLYQNHEFNLRTIIGKNESLNQIEKKLHGEATIKEIEDLEFNFYEEKKRIENKILPLDEKLKIENKRFSKWRSSFKEHSKFINEEPEKKLGFFLNNVKQFIFDLNSINDLKIISTEEVILQIDIVRNCALELNSFLDELLSSEPSPNKILTPTKSKEFKTLKHNNNQLLSKMRAELN